jgi:hypothetical protein
MSDIIKRLDNVIKELIPYECQDKVNYQKIRKAVLREVDRGNS